MLEAANLEVQAAITKQKLANEQSKAGPGGTPRQAQQARGGASSEILNFATGLGDKSISATVEKERAKAAKEQQKINKAEFDKKVMENTSDTVGAGGFFKGTKRTIDSRREEFIKSEAGKEAKGGKTLTDVYSVLEEALRKITSAPLVGGGS
jgi:hypothetical protein